MKTRLLLPPVVLLFFSSAIGAQTSDLSPSSWPEGDLEKYTQWNNTPRKQHRPVEGEKEMIAGVTQALAVRAGFEALRQGGSAADAVVACALADIVLAAGSTVTLAGEMVLAYYDSEERKVHSLIATFNTVLKEDDPLSIPPQGTPSGRATLVPGVAAGLEAVHGRFGKLPREELFKPAIYFARNGFPIRAALARRIKYREEVITRYPEGRKIFLREDGKLHGEGDLFKQEELAETLEKLSRQGSAYFYRGTWAGKFVEIVRREGGKMSLADMENYRVVWAQPQRTTFRDFEVFGSGLPSYGGINTAEALNLIELADLPKRGYYTSAPDALYWLIQISQVADLLSPPLLGSYVPEELVRKQFPDQDLTPSRRTKKEWAAMLWKKMQHAKWKEFQEEAALAREKDSKAIETISEGFGRKKSKHTSGVVAVDRYGNMAVLLHSINSSIWGDTGLFVDGVSIPDAGAFQQALIRAVGPGKKVPEWDNPTMVLKEGRPFLGCTAIGAAYHEANIQCLVNVLDYKADPQTATLIPPLRKRWPFTAPLKFPLGKGQFSGEVLKKVRSKGIPIETVDHPSHASFQGFWVGIRIDPETGRLQGGYSCQGNGAAIGF